MAAEPYKFGYVNASGEHAPFQYSNCWAIEKTKGPDRLIIAPAADHVEVMRRLTGAMRGPFGLLYVLVVLRGPHEAARYQSPAPLNSAQLDDFLAEFGDLLENDARHHFWISSIDNSGLLVYDNHNVVYAYGPLDAFEKILLSNGLARSENVTFPSPHVHSYNPEYDERVGQLLQHWSWIRFPLQDSDDR